MSVVRIELDTGTGAYPILIGNGLLRDGDAWSALVPGPRVLVVTDAEVAPHHLAPVRAALGARIVGVHVLPDGESSKTLARAGDLFSALAAAAAGRDACVLALGGGVVGDLAGFAAACWMRGIRFVQVPTTLLAMVDSSVGGKTGVNLPEGKNLVGAFHQPVAVLADTATLATLPAREFRAGLAEVVKYGAIVNTAFFAWCESHAHALLGAESTVIAEAIAASCRMKAAIVARDPLERGDRALLNFGHTFGHALERCAGYGELRHGEAVAIGMVLAARLSARMGRASSADSVRLARLLDALELPTRVPAGVPTSALVAAMRLDKKNLDGRLRLVLWRGIGAAEVVPDVDEADVVALLDDTGA